MTQLTYLQQLQVYDQEPPEAAAIRRQAATVKAQAAGKSEAEQQAAKYESYRLTSMWWRAVKR